MRVMQGIVAVALTASLALVASSVAAAQKAPKAPTPEQAARLLLASGVKAGMQKKLATMVKGLKVTKVTCQVPKNAKKLAGRCVARFTVARVKLNGVYQVKASMNGNGVVNWSTTSVKCTDSRTKKPIPC